jgi:hypothetical protein
VINEDEMIVEPVVDDWASEGQILDITLLRCMMMLVISSHPITWTVCKTK